MRFVDHCVGIVLVICLMSGCGRSNPEPTPLPVIAGPDGASAEVQAALDGLESPDPKRRALMVSRIGELAAEGEPVTSCLVEAMADPNPLVRVRVAEVLGEIGDAAAIPPLISRLQDKSEDRDVRARAAEALGKLEAAEAVEPLAAAMDDMFWHVRYHALVALGRIGDPRAESVIARAAEYDPHHENREVALQILEDWETDGA